ncbi:thioesterase II family protein [Nocardia sp. NPDC058379]|uniref:thioesterase II family protein n=1 Tax=unclassified Nocardia TaxID=2637762 RepID=UPI00364EAE5B
MGTRWLRRLSPAPGAESRKLVCFPHAGGSALAYGPLAKSIGADFDVLAVQYPGRQDRRQEPLVDSISGLVDGLLPELIEALDGDENFFAFGHSMGSVVAFETCRRLEQAGSTARVLFASGRRAPSAPQPGTVHLLDDRELAAQLLEFGGTPPALLADPEFRQLILSITRNDYRAIETYTCATETTVASPIVALAGADDADAQLADIQAWRTHTTGDFTATTFPGGHFYLDANLDGIGRLIREHSARALAR